MPHVITAPCVGRKDSSCYVACPVDAIHPTRADPDYDLTDQLYIDPVACIDCGACIPECPVEAIVRDDQLTPALAPFAKANADYYAAKWERPAQRDRPVSAGAGGESVPPAPAIDQVPTL